jgi:hypothetical protein
MQKLCNITNKDGKFCLKHSIGYGAQENSITRKASEMEIQQTKQL